MSEVSAFKKLAGLTVDQQKKSASEPKAKRSEGPPSVKVFNQVQAKPETTEEEDGEGRVKQLEKAVRDNEATKTTLNSVSSGAAEEVASENKAAQGARLETVNDAVDLAQRLAEEIGRQGGQALAAQPIGPENLERVGLA